jgi:hypothetical protein
MNQNPVEGAMTDSILPNDNNRLDRIEALVQSNAEAIAINAQAAAANTRNIDQLSQLQLRMMEEFVEYRRNMQEMRADILEMQSEVRGLQTENRRILDRLFNEN